MRPALLALLAFVALLAFLALLALGGCAGGPTGVRVPNRPPTVRITAGPAADSLHIHRVTFHWVGEDADGRVAGFEYAVDDTAAADSVHATAETEVALVFSADDFHDTVIEVHGGRPVELQRFGRHHSFFVRARDDAGAWSPFAFAAFFAVTVAPTTSILNPDPGGAPTVGTRFEVTWQGEDLDGRFPPRLFATRIVRVPGDSLLLIGPERLDVREAGPPWSPFREGTVERFEVEEGAYLIGVRAMDEAGAVEPVLRMTRNVIRLRASSTPGVPLVVLSGQGKTVTLPSVDEEAKTFDLISGRPAAFTWSADASQYGGRIADFAYGIDLESVDPNGPGWIPVSNPAVTVRLDNPAGIELVEHLFLLRIRDSLGQALVVDAILRVGPPDFTKEILVIDDVGGDRVGSPSNPRDDEHDRFIREVLLAEARRRNFTVDEVEFTDPDGRPVEGTPALAMLRHYRLLVWNAAGSNTGLTRAAQPGGGLPLAEYLTLGGNLWLFGQEVLTRSKAALVPETFGFDPGDLGYEFLEVRTRRSGSQIEAGGFLRPRGNLADQRVDGLDACRLTPEVESEGWPALLVAKEPYTSPLRGIPSVEGMTIGYDQGPEQAGDLDTLYTFVSNGSRLQPFPIHSRLDDAPCAFRFGGADDQGKVLVFTFPVYWWSDGAADSLGTRAISWFWDENRRRQRVTTMRTAAPATRRK